MAKVRLINKGMETFSSYMGITKFENGVSVSDVPQHAIRTLGALTSIEVIEDDGATHQGGVNAEMALGKKTGAPVLKDLKSDVNPDSVKHPVEVIPAPAKFSKIDKPAPADHELTALEQALTLVEPTASEVATEPTPVETDPVAKRIWTSDDLATIADKDGIRGLRAISDPLGIKNTSIVGLMQEVLASQGNTPIQN